MPAVHRRPSKSSSKFVPQLAKQALEFLSLFLLRPEASSSMNRLELDDTDSRIGYSGTWTPLTGSSRQWQSTTHTTTQTDASASIKFQGTRVVVYITIPIGAGTNVRATVTLDAKKSTFTHLTNSTTVYNFILFDSGPISDIPHTLSLANAGSTSDSPLQFDRFHLEGDNFNVSPGGSVSSAAPPKSAPGGVSPTSPGPSRANPTVVSTTVHSSNSSLSTSGTPNSIFGSSVLSPLAPSGSTPTPSSSALGGARLGDGSGTLQNLADPPAQKGSNNGLPLQTATHGATSISVRLVTSTEADGTVVTNVVSVPPGPGTPPSATFSRVPTGAVVGAVFAGIALLSLFVFLVRLARRRRACGHVQLYDGNESVRSPSDMTTATPFRHDDGQSPPLHQPRGKGGTANHEQAGHASSLEKPSSGRGRDTAATQSPSPSPVTPYRSRQNTLDLDLTSPDNEPGTYPYHVYIPRLDQLGDVGPVPIGSSVMLLMMDSQEAHDSPPSYQDTL